MRVIGSITLSPNGDSGELQACKTNFQRCHKMTSLRLRSLFQIYLQRRHELAEVIISAIMGACTIWILLLKSEMARNRARIGLESVRLEVDISLRPCMILLCKIPRTVVLFFTGNGIACHLCCGLWQVWMPKVGAESLILGIRKGDLTKGQMHSDLMLDSIRCVGKPVGQCLRPTDINLFGFGGVFVDSLPGSLVQMFSHGYLSLPSRLFVLYPLILSPCLS